MVGIYKPNNNINIDGENAVFIPFTTFQKSFNTGDRMGWMAISVESGTKVAAVEKQIKAILKNKYDIAPNDERAIGSFDMSEIFNNISAFTNVLKGFSFFVGIFTLLAGVIAISNILLITVKERTKEIGIRKALGAQPKSIISIILLESILITIIAGFVGLFLGMWVLDLAAPMLEEYFLKDPSVDTSTIVGATITLIIAGAIAGYLPAKKASRIKPIVALRDE